LRLLALCALLAYWALLVYQLGAQWSVYSQYSYGWAVPLLCAYLIWQRVKGKPPLAVGDQRILHLSPTILGLLLVVLALLYAPTRFLHEANPIWRFTTWLWVLEILAMTLLLLAVLSPRLAVRLAFPVGFFLVAVPWPSVMENLLVQTLTRLNVGTTIELLSLFGIPAVQHGNIIEISSGVVGVDEACSGIRSFQATLMLSLFFGELYSLTAKRRIVLCLLGFASSLFFNLVRTLSLTYIASKQGVPELEKWHDPAGVTVLVWCFVAVWFLSLVMKPYEEEQGKKVAKPGAKGEAAEGSKSKTTDGRPRTADQRSVQPSAFSLQPSLISLGLIAWLILVEVGVEWWYRSHEQFSRSTGNWTLDTSDSSSSYTRVDTPETVISQFNADENLELRWQDDLGARWQLYYFRWLPAVSLKKRVSVQLAKTHGPEKCLPAAGMTLQAYLGIKQVEVNGLRMALQHYIFGSPGRPVHVFYAIYEDPTGTESLANRRRDPASRLSAALAGSRNYGQRFLELAVWGLTSEQQAEAKVQRQLTQIVKVER
jgi:exosortase